MKKYRLNKILQTGFISFAFLLISCDLCYYCEEATYKFIPEKMEAEQEGNEIFVFHFISGIVGGTNDESPAGTKFTLEYYWSESSSDYSSGTKITNAKGGALVYNYSNGDWGTNGDIPTTQMPSEFEYVLNTESTRTGYIFSFDVPDGLDNGTYYVHAVAKCSCGGEEGSSYTNLGVVTTIDLSVGLEVYPYSTISYSWGSPLSSVTQNDTVWINASLSSTPAIGDLSELGGSVISKFGDITILSGSGSSFYDALQGKVFWNSDYTKFYYATILLKDDYAPGTYDLTLTINQNTYNESNPANNTATKSIEMKELITESVLFESTISLSEWNTLWYTGPGWERSTSGPYGTYSASMGPITSTTASDGFALVDADYLGSSGVTTNRYIYTNDRLPIDPSKETLSLEMEYYFKASDDEVHYYVKFYNGTSLIVNTGKEIPETASMSSMQLSSNPTKVTWDLTDHIQYYYNSYPSITHVKIGLVYIDSWGYAFMFDDIKIMKKSISGKIEENTDIARQYVINHTLPLDIEEQDARMNAMSSSLNKLPLEAKNKIKSKETK